MRLAGMAICSGLLIGLAACGQEAADRNQASAAESAPIANETAVNEASNAADPHAGHDMNDMNAMNEMNMSQ